MFDQSTGQRLSLGRYQLAVEERLAKWQAEKFCNRLWRKDPTLWFSQPVQEITDRLGWLALPESMAARCQDLESFASAIKSEGYLHAVLIGMGGASLAAEIFQRTFGNREGQPELVVLDSTHPAAVRRVENSIDLKRTLFIVCSKSGTTIETLSGLHYFWQRLVSGGTTPGPSFVAITDPRTPLESFATERGFRRVFQAPGDVGGRYSALSVFGLVPAALIGVDIASILDNARSMAAACASDSVTNPALALGAVLGELAVQGRDKITFMASPRLAAVPEWIEQLIAESTGKHGKGILPVTGEEPFAPEFYGVDRLFAYLRLTGDENDELDQQIAQIEGAGHPTIRIDLGDACALGGEFFRWELAVASAGAILGIDPFDQPDVQLAKARSVMTGRRGAGSRAEDFLPVGDEGAKEKFAQLLRGVQPGDYLGIQAYLVPSSGTSAALQQIRIRLRNRFKIATTIGYGPRFLHSMGQMHKGGPNTGVFLQLVDEPGEEIPVPETNHSFRELIRAQAAGDGEALRERGRRFLGISLGREPMKGFRSLTAWLNEPEFEAVHTRNAGQVHLCMVGMGRMGGSMTERLLRAGYQVVACDRDVEAVARAGEKGAAGATSLGQAVATLQPRRVIWLMIPAGAPVEQAIEELVGLLEKGDVIVDGGNSNYRDSVRRAAMLKGKGLHFVDVGTSGGNWGLEEGYSLMVGGEREVVERLKPIFAILAPALDQGWGHVGPPGAGHFVKMIHNGIEDGLMQAFAEGFAIMERKREFDLNLEQIAEIWRHGSVLRSWLLDLIAKTLSENPTLAGIKPYVADSGAGRWTVTEAMDLQVSAPVITLSLLERLRSRDENSYGDRLRAMMRHQFGGGLVKKEE